MDKFTFFKNLDRILKLLLKAKEKNYTQNFSELTIGIESSDVPLEMLFERLVEDNNVKKIDMNKTARHKKSYPFSRIAFSKNLIKSNF